tara:strand:+ start:40 stop:297 length:258 start_codon:yes stop_codon:yes gene_type:complete
MSSDEKDNKKVNEQHTTEKENKEGFFSGLFGKKEVDCDLLLNKMRECVNEKNGTTMCNLEVDEWEKHCSKKEEETTEKTNNNDDE